MLVFDFSQTLGNRCDGFLPGCGMEFAIFATDERFSDSIFMMNKIVCEPAFDTEVSVIKYFTWRWTGNFYDATVVSVQIKLTSNTAKVTG